jgi:hypothetical protein
MHGSESVIAEQDMLKFGEIRFLTAAILPKSNAAQESVRT